MLKLIALQIFAANIFEQGQELKMYLGCLNRASEQWVSLS